jgi:xyloglucan:xyloglucosyl transferase
VVAAAVVVVAASAPPAEAAFDDNYVAQWGRDGYHLVVRGTEANVTMDQSSGTYVRTRTCVCAT